VDHIWDYIHPVLVAIHRTVNNVELPYTEEEVQKHVSDWAGYMNKKYAGLNVFPGVVGAVDGFVIERTRPTQRELNGKDFRTYLNRAGVFAWVSMAIVGVYCQFLMFEIKSPGATNGCCAFEVGGRPAVAALPRGAKTRGSNLPRRRGARPDLPRRE